MCRICKVGQSGTKVFETKVNHSYFNARASSPGQTPSSDPVSFSKGLL